MEFDKVIRKRTATRSFNLNDNIEPICLLPIGYKTDDYLESPMHNVRKELEEMVRYM
jgi:nitroreductase